MDTRLPSVANRTYAGYSPRQSSVIVARVDELSRARGGLRVLDPMAGQAAELLKIAAMRDRIELCLRDLNPAALLYAEARVLSTAEDAMSVLDSALGRLAEVPEALIAADRQPFLDSWLPPAHTKALEAIGRLVAEPWFEDPRRDLMLIACVLAARSIATFQTTKNPTHFRRGGIVRGDCLANLVRAQTPGVLAHFRSQMAPGSIEGRVHLELGDSTRSATDTESTFDLVVVSPPYGNSLDYSRLWSPEVAVVAALGGHDWMETVRRDQLGTSTVVGRPEPDISLLPDVAREALRQVRADDVPYADSYYFPKFAHFLVGLRHATLAAARSVADDGHLIMFIRDTVRRDVVVPAAAVVRDALEEAGLGIVDMSLLVVRSHVGLRRKSARPSLTGTAQREWVIEARREP